MIRLRENLPVILVVCVLLLFWWALASSKLVPSYLLPSPGQVAMALWAELTRGRIVGHLLLTCKTWLIGFVLGSLAGFVISVIAAEFKLIGFVVMPIVVALQSVPKIALAPLIFVWVGFGQSSIVIVAALASYFPVLSNTLAGLKDYDRDLESLYRSCGSGSWLFFFDVKLPGAARQVIAGLELSLIFALIGNVVMEFLVGSKGLGYVIQDSANAANLPLNFSAILLLAAAGITLSSIFRAVSRRLIFWESSNPTEQRA